MNETRNRYRRHYRVVTSQLPFPFVLTLLVIPLVGLTRALGGSPNFLEAVFALGAPLRFLLVIILVCFAANLLLWVCLTRFFENKTVIALLTLLLVFLAMNIWIPI